MKSGIKHIFFALLLAVVSSSIVWADKLDDGIAAYEQQDYKTALNIFRGLVQKGYAGGQYNLGVMYSVGNGVPQDYAEAVKLYRLAAQQGYLGAQLNLGVMYYLGRGVPQDNVKAHMWLNLAAVSGYAGATKGRDIAASNMTPAQIAEAQRMARDCTAKKLKGCD